MKKPRKANKSIIKKYGCAALCVLMIMTYLLTPVFALEKETIRVGWYEDSYHTTGRNGDRSGYGYEYEQAIAAYTGWNYNYVEGGWDHLIDLISCGDIDLLGTVSYTEDRAKMMLFSDVPMGEERYYLYANLIGSTISADNLSTLNGRKVALLKKSIQTTRLIEWEKKNNIHLEHVYVEDLQEAMDKASCHDIDCVVSTETPVWVKFGMSAVTSIGGSKIYYAISKKRPDLKKQLDNAMRKMNYDNPFYSDELYKKFLSASSTPLLTKEELEWLSKHGDIKIGYLKKDIGYSYLDEKSKKIQGVMNDYILSAKNCLQNKTLDFTIIPYDSLDDQIKAIQKGEIDVIFHFVQNPYIAQQKNLALSATVLNASFIAITTKKMFNEVDQNVVAIEKGNDLLKWSLAYNYPHWTIIECDSKNQLQKVVKTKEADCFVIDSNYINEYYEDNQFYYVSLTQTGNISFAIKRQNTQLMSILNKTLKTTSSTMLSGALSMYINANQKTSFIDFIKEHIMAVTISLVLIILIMSFLLRKSYLAEKKTQEAVHQSNELNKELAKNKEKLETALIRAEDASISKTTFLNHMSHDIRTPMNAIIGFTNIALKQESNPILKNCLEKIKASSDLLLSLINDVLDISRIESGNAHLNLAIINLKDLTDDLKDITTGLIGERDLKLNASFEQMDNPYVYADPIRLREILVNVLSNAVKFTNDGGTITFNTTYQWDTETNTYHVSFIIQDTGIGMSPEFQEHIFDEFAQEQSDSRTQYKGTGLGMPITKGYVDMMKGTIQLQSEQNKGTLFVIEIPFEIANPSEETKENVSSSCVQGLHLLLVEDNALNAEIAKIQLEEAGFIVSHASDGVEAVEAFINHDVGTYDAILMDIMMPHMNGYEATRTIRHLNDRKDGQDIPIIAMTANAFVEDIKASLDAGMNDHLSKPMIMEKVIKTIVKNVGQSKKK